MTDYELEIKLKDFLIKNPSILEDSIKKSLLNYDFIKVDSVEIDDEYFSCCCYIYDGGGRSISPFLPIPIDFLRSVKLNKIKERICSKSVIK